MKIFLNKAALAAATLTAGQLVETKGYYTAGDGGQARYLIKTAADYGATPDEYGDHTLANGNVAVLQYEGAVNVKQFGANGDGINTASEAIGACLNYAILAGSGNVIMPAGVYLCDTPITLDNFSNLTISGYGAVIDFRVSNFLRFGDFTEDISGYFTQTSVTVSDIKIEGLEFEPQVDTYLVGTNRWSYLTPISISSASDVKIQDCTFRDWDFSAIDMAAPCKNVIVEKCKFISSREAIDNYGVRTFCFVAPLENINEFGQLSYPAPTVYHNNITVQDNYFFSVSHSILSWNVHNSLYINNFIEKIGVRGISVTNWNFDCKIHGNKYVVSDNTVPTISTCIRVGIGCERVSIHDEIFSGSVSGTGVNANLKIVHIGSVGRDIVVDDNTFNIVGADNNIVVDFNTEITIRRNRFLKSTNVISCINIVGDDTGIGTYDILPALIENNYVKQHTRFIACDYEPVGNVGVITIRNNVFDTLLTNRLFASNSASCWIVSAYENDFPLGGFNYQINFGVGSNKFIRLDKNERSMVEVDLGGGSGGTLDWRDYGGDTWYLINGASVVITDVTNENGDGQVLRIICSDVTTFSYGNFLTVGAVDAVLGTNDFIQFVNRSGFWFEQYRAAV